MKLSEATGTQTLYKNVTLYSNSGSTIKSINVGRKVRDRTRTVQGPIWTSIFGFPFKKPKAYFCLIEDDASGIFVERSSYNANPSKNYSEKAWTISAPVSPPLWVENLRSQLQIECNVNFLNKVNKRKVSILEEFKQLQETLKTLADTATKIVDIYKEMRRNPFAFLTKALGRASRGKRKELRRQIKTAGDLWLQGRYFWLPLYMTMRDCMIQLQDKFAMFKVYHEEYDTWVWTSKYVHNQVPDCFLEMEYTLKDVLQIGSWFTMDIEGLAQLRANGVGSLTDLTAVAWELAPFSLAVDWVLPVSDILLAMNSLSGLSSHMPWQTRTTTVTGKVKELKLPAPRKGLYWTSTYELRDQPEYSSETYRRYTEQLSNLDVRPFIAKQPLNVKRALDALAFFSGTDWSKKILSGRT